MTTVELAAMNLEIERLAALLALAEALTRVGRLRTGERSGQFSIHNFRVRAAYDFCTPDPGPGGALVVLMRAGVWRRHTWFCALREVDDERGEGEPPGDDQKAGRLELAVPRPLEGDWEWWPGVEEMRGRLEASDVWQEAVGEPFEELQAGYAARLAGVRVVVGEGRLPSWGGAEGLGG